MSGVETQQRHLINDDLQQVNTSDLYTQLWYLCAGPLVYVPQQDDLIYYFPQGHLEQVKAYTKPDEKIEMPVCNLPSKILFKVTNVKLMVEEVTDEVFAHVILFPVSQSQEHGLGANRNDVPATHAQRITAKTFTKKLTISDTSTHGGCSIPRHGADDCLPPLNMSSQTPEQYLLVKDLHGNEWNFRHTYRGKPKRNLFTSGWSSFLAAKKLDASDELIFMREGNRNCAGVRRAKKVPNLASANIISGDSMIHGILSSCLHAFLHGGMFTVYYHPWICPSQFMIPYDKYRRSAEIQYSPGTRFRMSFEKQNSVGQRIVRLEGTITGKEDVDHIRWRNSEWKCLKVEWDHTSDSIALPDRVSHWDIEPIITSSVLPPRKRARDHALVFGGSTFGKAGSSHSPIEPAPRSQLGVFQGQEKRGTSVNESETLKITMLQSLFSPPNPDVSSTSSQSHNPQNLQSIKDRFDPSFSTFLSLSCGNSSYHDLKNSKKSTNFPQTGSQEQKDVMDFENIPNGNGKCRIFGIDLGNNPTELPSRQVGYCSDFGNLYHVPEASQSSVSEPSKTTSVKNLVNQCMNCHGFTNRSCIKVLKYGSEAEKTTDLRPYEGYDELIRELDQMFKFKGSLVDGSSGWQVTYTDSEGRMLLFRGCSWKEFQRKVTKMFIWPSEGVDSQNQS